MEKALFIDGENFKYKIKYALENEEGGKEFIAYEYDFSGLFNKVLKGLELDKRIFYGARIGVHSDTKEKSENLIRDQRLLKTNLEKQGYDFIYGGRVRGHIVKDKKGKEVLIFKEKGVDVKIAVDMIVMAYIEELKTAVIASSDSDLLPAIDALKKKGVELIYLGFESGPNKGISYAVDRTILIRNSEILEHLPGKLID